MMQYPAFSYYCDTKYIAERALKSLVEDKNNDEQANHHIRNVVTILRSVKPEQYSDQEIMDLCDSAWRRLTPFIRIILTPA